MIKNFEEVKQQLRELAEIVNAYKSEAVQLRVIELVFTASTTNASRDDHSTASPKQATARPRPRRGASEAREGSTGRSNRKLGGRALLNRLYSEGFFKGKQQTIGSIVAHADSSLATKVKQSDLSGPLAKYVREGKLKRSKNSENQYEYAEP